ncbi:Rha family transcriptional regulator [Campylobacter hyointestinalis]|uniref:Transcriptional regulator n=1 Tax=Campylobacter hyointestinalis subsp. hyointestinalis TaxID=91352 RepID=A0A855N8X2_CAMHY|nr:Rha family transcriptional regulator [Campylobacter hyointestinalis]PPB56355.1 transcriptional regulator [Campylobacter hyointestinalis subsp. hyointestinalis]PPB61222.1 transcriptional regulator [Campylobacter hyointestinalis subsp. hyointestinalis]PPB70454.1 transcriptional regulator [Campylobacter hyointestinalis subsp. hyointestinalis]
MSVLININDVEVKFEIVGDDIFADSLKIAEVFGKNHHNILRLIKNLLDYEFKLANFKAGFYLNSQNKQQPMYNITRDGKSSLSKRLI